MNSDKEMLLKELEFALKNEFLDVWYPAALDTVYGGFLSDFTFDWRPEGQQNKMIVTQSRQVWTASRAAMFYQDDKYRKIAEHGFNFLRDKMWDKTYGGFYQLRDRQGNLIPYGDGLHKVAYGNAFAIYALATYYEAFGDTSALDLARQTFAWLEKHNHDSQYKGYVDATNLDGSWIMWHPTGKTNRDITETVLKDYNSSIHLLEAFTQLYKVWPDSLVRERLLEMLTLVRDTFVNKKGYLNMYFTRDWQPLSVYDFSAEPQEADYFFDHVSFGHDVETAYLLLEAEHILGKKSYSVTLPVARALVDHALENGWDQDNGGLYYQGYYFDGSDTITIFDDTKEWWVQAEALNAFLLMAKLFPQDKKYYEAFRKQWEYIQRYLIDHQHGGWYSKGLDKSPERAKGPKGYDWKVNYHETRALINCIQMLKDEHELLK